MIAHATTTVGTGMAILLVLLSLGVPVPAMSGERQEIAVTTVTAYPERRVLPIRASGALANKREIRLSFKTGGIVSELLAEEGSLVSRGDLLARLDAAEIDAALDQASARREKAARDLTRLESIYRKKVITLEQLQNARTELDVAEAGLEIARFNKRHAVIRAPADGTVLRRLAEPDELVTAGTPVYRLATDNRGWVVRLWLADRDVVRLRLGDLAQLSLDALPNLRLAGEVSEIAAAAERRAGLFEVEVALVDDHPQLRAGFIARVLLRPTSEAPLHYLPMESVVSAQADNAQIFLFDPSSGRVSRHTVGIAHLLDGEIAVHSGLQGRQMVVSKGARYLRDGQRVLRVDDELEGGV